MDVADFRSGVIVRPIIEPLLGVVNGTNKLFETTAPYVPNSVVVFLNGQAKVREHDDGWEELGHKRIRLKEAPHVDDDVMAYYLIP